MTKTPLQRPDMFRGITDNCEVRFTYLFAGGEEGYVSGRFVKFTGRVEDDGTRVVTGIEVKPNVNSRIPTGSKLTADGTVRCGADRITPDRETGLIVPVSKKEMASGTGAARFIGPSDRAVTYALSLCGHEGEPGGRNFPHYTEAQFRAMGREEIRRWIDMAKFELGLD